MPQYPAINRPPPSAGVRPCMYCNEALDISRGYEQVVAFRQRRQEGGPNQVIVPTPTGRWACRGCVDKMRIGVHPLQAAMFG